MATACQFDVRIGHRTFSKGKGSTKKLPKSRKWRSFIGLRIKTLSSTRLEGLRKGLMINDCQLTEYMGSI